MGQLLDHIKSEDILSLSLKVIFIQYNQKQTDYSVSFPIFESQGNTHETYEKELTGFEKRQLERKEKRLKKLNASRVKKEVIPKIKPHKPL